MSHTIRNQYDLLAGTEALESDFKAMLDWLSQWEMKPCTSLYFGEEVNAILVNNWIGFRNSLSNIPKQYDREYLEECAREECEPDDFYEIDDCLDEITDGQLMAIGRLFYTADMVKKVVPEPITSIAVKWGIEDIQSIRTDLTDEQASTVLQAADRCHNAEIGINWDVLRIHADDLFPEDEQGDEQDTVPSEVNSKYADSIIAGNPANYNAIEVHGVRNINDADDIVGTHYEVNDENPELYSVYLHCVGGGIECVGDFSTQELALVYANELSGFYSWKVRNFAQENINLSQEVIDKCLRGHHPNQFVEVDWDVIYSKEPLAHCSGDVVCIFTESYDSLEDAARSGAVYFGSQPICTRAELEGALIGHEMTVKATGVKSKFYFVQTR